MSGISFITNLTGIIFAMFSQSQTEIPEIKIALKSRNIYQLILKSHSTIIDNQLKYIDSSESRFSDMYSTYVPMLDKPSRILPNNEKVILI